MVNTKVSVNRLNEFFAEEEIKPEELGRLESSKADAIRLKGATFAWGAKELNPTLNDVNFTAKRGQLVAIVGRVGSGKSSLLQAILGKASQRKICRGVIRKEKMETFFLMLYSEITKPRIRTKKPTSKLARATCKWRNAK